MLLAAGMATAYIVGTSLRLAALAGLQLPVLPLGIAQVHFGFDQISHLGAGPAAGGLALLLLVTARWARITPGLQLVWRSATSFAATRLGSFVIALACGLLFCLLRNEFVNQDGRAFLHRFLEDVPTKGAHVTHDEMWELYIHSRAWYWATIHLGWTLIQTYQRISVAAGVVFVFLLLRLCRLIWPQQSLVLFLAVTAGGYVQLFFGDVENYTLTAVVVVAYLYLGLACLREGVPLIAPSVALALAITFHLLAGFFIPSLAYLWWRVLRKDGLTAILVPGVAFVAILAATLAFFHMHNLPIFALFTDSHALGHGGHILLMLARPSLPYYWQQFNLLALLLPSSCLILPLLAFRRIPATPTNAFLGLASLFLLLFQFSWYAALGVYNDWNLYAISAIPTSILVWTNYLAHVPIPRKDQVAVFVAGLAALHTFSWILSNRLYGFL